MAAQEKAAAVGAKPQAGCRPDLSPSQAGGAVKRAASRLPPNDQPRRYKGSAGGAFRITASWAASPAETGERGGQARTAPAGESNPVMMTKRFNKECYGSGHNSGLPRPD